VRYPGEQFARALRAGRRHGRHDERLVRVALAQRPHQGRRSLDLADRDGVHPQAGAAVRHGAQAETLAEVVPIAVVAKAPQQHRDADDGRQQVHHAQVQQAHRRELLAQLGQAAPCGPSR